jgi:hypothetical protein
MNRHREKKKWEKCEIRRLERENQKKNGKETNKKICGRR